MQTRAFYHQDVPDKIDCVKTRHKVYCRQQLFLPPREFSRRHAVLTMKHDVLCRQQPVITKRTDNGQFKDETRSLVQTTAFYHQGNRQQPVLTMAHEVLCRQQPVFYRWNVASCADNSQFSSIEHEVLRRPQSLFNQSQP